MMIRNSKFLLLTLFSIIYLPAYTQNWTGNVDSDWNNPANWSSWPLDGEDITIDPALYTGGAFQPIVSNNSVFTPAEVLIQNGGILTINASLTTEDDVEVLGQGSAIHVINGTFSVNPGDGGRLIMETGAEMQINGTVIVDERYIIGEDALVNLNGGSVTSGERLIVEGGGQFIQNAGTVNIAATFAIVDGSVNNDSKYVLNDGILNVTGEMEFENETGDFTPSFEMNNGDLNINGDLFWFGVTPGTGTPKMLLNGGNAVLNGLIQNMPLSTVNMYLQLSGNAELQYSGTLIETLNATDSIIQTGNSKFIISGTNVINNVGVIYADDVHTEFNGSTTLQGNGEYQLDTVLISNATLALQNTSGLKISGDLNQNGTFLSNTQDVIFNGDVAQNINSSNTVDLYDLTMANNSSTGLYLNTTAVINNHLSLDSGKVYTNSVNKLIIEDNATADSGNVNSYISGPMIKKGDDAFIFPIGKNGHWQRLGISAPASVNDEFEAEYFNTSYSSISPVNSPLMSVSNIEYWDLEQLNGNSDVSVTLYWEDANLSGITNCNNLSIANWNGSAWNNVFSNASGTCTGNGNGFITSNSTVNNYGPFSFGFYAGVTTQNFSICTGDTITVGTNDYFATGTYIDVLQDTSNNDSVVITNLTVHTPYTTYTVSGITISLDSTNADSYQWIDCINDSLLAGETGTTYTADYNSSFAVIVTVNGCTDTSQCALISTVGVTKHASDPTIILYPNPGHGQYNLQWDASLKVSQINLYDPDGRLVKSFQPDPANNYYNLDVNIADGIYHMLLQTDQGIKHLKLLKQ